MDLNGLPPAEPNRRSCGLLFAVLLSFAVHGLFALALWTLPAAHSRTTDDAPLAEVPVVVVPVDEFTVSLASESPRGPKKTDATRPGSEPAPELISVQSLPLNSGTASAADVAMPRVTGGASDGGPSRGGMGGGTGTGDVPSFFGVSVQARSVVFLIDRSISMGGLSGHSGLDAAKRELLATLEVLAATTRYQVYFYNREVECVPSTERDGLLANTDETRQGVLQLVSRIRPKAGTDHMMALHQALALHPEAILLITDADDLRPDQVRAITALNAGHTAIHTLLWSMSPDANEPLKALAQLNRGIHRRIDHRYQARID